jgi:Zn-finger nucleic acid-binding protein
MTRPELMKEDRMFDSTCPWCETDLVLGAKDRDEDQCPECLTTWRYEDEDVVELALAA